ncbi:MAG: arylesterase [Bacteroidota bacterium]
MMQKQGLFSPFSLLCLLAISLLLTTCSAPAETQEQTQNETAVQEATSETEEVAPLERPRIVFFGNSLTAGYGLDEKFSFPSRVQEKLDSSGFAYQVVNAGISGETTAGGVSSIDWVMEQPISIFVLELGGNDVLRGFDLKNTRENLRQIFDAVQAKYPEAKLVVAGMEAPPNMGEDYTSNFRQIYRELATDYEAALIPFLLDGVGGIPELNLPDRIHPNEEGQKIVAQNVWDVIHPLLENAG